MPELIFGQLLTSSNYNDEQKKVTGGRNGFGAKLANIFSTEFIIETGNADWHRTYRQVFSDNMAKKGEPKIRENVNTDDFTKITFKPDLKKFGMHEGLNDDTVALLTKRAYDIAGATDGRIRVKFNGKLLPIRTFSQYVDLYL